MKKSLMVFLVAAALIAAGFVLVESRDRNLPLRQKVVSMEVSYAVNVEDPRALAGFADNIFFGKVATTHGTVYRKGHRTMPWTHYEVSVTGNIKGGLEGKVSVLQEGGYSPEDQRTYLIQKDALLTEGAEYLFATRQDETSNVHVIVPVYGDIRVRDSRDRGALLKGFTAAVNGQIPFKEPKLEQR